jgi:hypothetical protein
LAQHVAADNLSLIVAVALLATGAVMLCSSFLPASDPSLAQ